MMRVTLGSGKARVSYVVTPDNRYTLTERVLNRLNNRRDGHRGRMSVRFETKQANP
mgnify:CR=1 FL=1